MASGDSLEDVIVSSSANTDLDNCRALVNERMPAVSCPNEVMGNASQPNFAPSATAKG